jgi:hypothetical protein
MRTVPFPELYVRALLATFRTVRSAVIRIDIIEWHYENMIAA